METAATAAKDDRDQAEHDLDGAEQDEERRSRGHVPWRLAPAGSGTSPAVLFHPGDASAALRQSSAFSIGEAITRRPTT